MDWNDKEQVREYKRKWIAKNKDKCKEQWERNYAKNGNKIRERARLKQAKIRKEHPEKVKVEKQRSYHKTKHRHKEKVAAYGKIWQQDNKEHRATYSQRKHREFKLKIIEYLGGSCVSCGLTGEEYWPCFDTHHVDPSQKAFPVGKAKCRPWETVKLELNKCVLLCSNCHRRFHSGLIPLDIYPIVRYA